MLALVELQDEPRIGHPKVAWSEARGPGEVPNAVAAMGFDRRDGTLLLGMDRCADVRTKVRGPGETMVRYALVVGGRKKLAYSNLAFTASFGVTHGLIHGSISPIPLRAHRQCRRVLRDPQPHGRARGASCLLTQRSVCGASDLGRCDGGALRDPHI